MLSVRADIEDLHGTPVYYPFVPYSGQRLRTAQAYLTKVPRAFVDLFPELHSSVALESIQKDLGPRSTRGLDYRTAKAAETIEPESPWTRDPALIDRALAAHAGTQNALANYLKSIGLEPLSPAPEEPDFDLAWVAGGMTFVAEVKSLSATNEEKQLRLGLGQLLRYQHALAADVGVLAVERQPSDDSWMGLLDQLGIRMAWPGAWEQLHL